MSAVVAAETTPENQSQRTVDAMETTAAPTSSEQVHHEKPIFYPIAQNFMKATEEEDLDIYQVCAWVAYQDDMNTPTKIVYYAKALVCWAIQVPGLLLFLIVDAVH